MQQMLPNGLYDQILTDELASELNKNFRDSQYTFGPLDATIATCRLADSPADVLQEIGSVSAVTLMPKAKLVVEKRS